MKRDLAMRIRRNRKKPGWWRTVIVSAILPLIFRVNDGIYVLNEEWDNIIILDACRYDVFKDAFEGGKFGGRLESRISRGTDTASFQMRILEGEYTRT